MNRILKSSPKTINSLFFRNKFTISEADKIEVTIDGEKHRVSKQYTVWQACNEAGVTVPRFCFHERLNIAGNCRMCLVEVKGSPKPVASCQAGLMPGMQINTKSEAVRKNRGNVLEFLLANHPLDCPICDQGGECDLQDITETYSYGEGRYREYKRAVEDKNYGPLVGTKMDRCIHCTRCTRFTTEIAGQFTLGKTGRGKFSEIGGYVEKLVSNEMSGNIVDICPVGALTNLPYQFTTRPWELKSTYSTDVFDSLGSNICIDARGAEVLRVLPRVHEDINEEWISDKSRHAFDGLKRQRITNPMRRNEQGEYENADWEYCLRTVGEKLNGSQGSEISAVIGEFADVESIVALKDLLNRFDSDNFEIRTSGNVKVDPDFRSNYVMNSSIIGVEDADVLLLVGCNPKYEAPCLNSRLVKCVRDLGLKVFTIGSPIDLPYNYVHLGSTTKVLNEIADGSHPFAARLNKAKLPMILIGANTLSRADGPAIHDKLKYIANNSPVISSENSWNGLNILHKDIAKVGALDVGLNPCRPKDMQKSKVVILLGADNNIKNSDIPEDAFVVYIGTTGDEGAYYADIILPGAGYYEKDATYVNTEGRVQLGRAAVPTAGQAMPDWKIIRALSEESGVQLPYDTIEELRYRMAELAPHLLKYDYIEPTVFGQVASKSTGTQPLEPTPITDHIDNFYMTDAISRNSTTMAKCSTAFNPVKFSNFRVFTKQ